MIDVDELKALARPKGMPFRIGKLGHVVINVRDVARSVRFYTEVLGFEVSDIYPDDDGAGRHGLSALQPRPPRHRAGRLAVRRGGECRAEPHRLRGRDARGGAARPRSPAPPRGRDRFRGPSPRRLPARRRIPRSRQSPPRDLLGYRPDRQRRPGAAEGGMERGARASRPRSPIRSRVRTPRGSSRCRPGLKRAPSGDRGFRPTAPPAAAALREAPALPV